MSTTVSPQNVAVAHLERLGFELANAFSCENGKIIVMTRGEYARPGCKQVEIEPDGTCNGEAVADYIRAL